MYVVAGRFDGTAFGDLDWFVLGDGVRKDAQLELRW